MSNKPFYDKSLYGDNWNELAKQCKKRDNHTCKMCGYNQKMDNKFKYLHADHITPLSKGGANRLSNLQTLCESCHEKKTNRTRSIRTSVSYTERKKKPSRVKRVRIIS